MNTHGFISLWIRVGYYAAKVRFLVRDQLPVPLILGAPFIDWNFAVRKHEDQTAPS